MEHNNKIETISAKEAADRLGMTTSYIYQLVNEHGLLHAIKTPKTRPSVRITLESFERYLAERETFVEKGGK